MQLILTLQIYQAGKWYRTYRYYQPSTGRWMSRDSLEEQGGVGLYSFIRNDPIGNEDLLGQLSYNTVVPPVGGVCGGYSAWKITWQLPTPASLGGYVIQHTKVKKTVTGCDGIPEPSLEWDFFEAPGNIPQGSLTTHSVYDDAWLLQALSETTKGKIVITGTATFYDNGQVLPSYFSPPGYNPPGSPPTGGLPYSYAGPPWPGGGSVSRSMTVTWDCCCTSGDHGTHISY